MFNILVKEDPLEIDGECVFSASIIINDFEEKVYLPLSYWSLSDYRESWKSEVEEGLNKNSHSVLAVSMYESSKANFIFSWVLYYSGNDVFIQNKIIFLDEHPNFTVESINSCIGSRKTHTEDGMQISEWHTDLNSIKLFYNSLK
ncbi:hypothetical protein ERHA54_45310 [Erwinia rhapontici]|uniref:CdiI C-terminal domain-containing protein n=1 Tax=Erwinia rhapontici TaxID=55212 RepID=A0ABM7N612_ERWRD|nr:hypothetical protein [Erwinia rhapontici]BCQ36920.1 hypothetical protein ERHA53_42630 [Erwinia rhapontici]BCQ41928.1 hypothetical protein ERHA54_45310 [Erwinia rhapontici]BCQ47262.1 hypothetical protein ERHA55_47890 [Erwinia rhapontici]